MEGVIKKQAFRAHRNIGLIVCDWEGNDSMILPNIIKWKTSKQSVENGTIPGEHQVLREEENLLPEAVMIEIMIRKLEIVLKSESNTYFNNMFHLFYIANSSPSLLSFCHLPFPIESPPHSLPFMREKLINITLEPVSGTVSTVSVNKVIKLSMVYSRTGSLWVI